jgi:hypothetical protein
VAEGREELARAQQPGTGRGELTAGGTQGTGRRFEVTRVPQREGNGILSVLDPASGHVPDPFLLLIDGRRAGGTYWCAYNPAPTGFGRDDGGLPGRSWASWGPRGLSCGHPTREAAEQVQVDVYRTDPDGWDMRLAEGHADLSPERDRPDGARFWDHRTNRDFWAGYSATLARVRAERPSTVGGVAAILNGFQAPSAGIAFFGNNADDRLSDALADAGWELRFLEGDYLWEARHPGTGEQLHCVEGDVVRGPYGAGASAGPGKAAAPARGAPLDAPAEALLAALRAAPEGDVLWSKEGDDFWIARRAPMAVLLRAGDLLHIPDVDHYSQLALADEVTRAARGPAIAATVGSTVDFPGNVKPAPPASGAAAPSAPSRPGPQAMTPAKSAGAR